MSAQAPLLIVGGGPAGMAAAIEAARAKLPALILDEAPSAGGQIYRQIPADFSHRETGATSREATHAAHLRDELASFGDLIQWRARTAVLGVTAAREVHWSDGARSGSVRAEQLILATGAYDRPVPFPGWTLPGVMTAGGTQSFLKAFGIKPGGRAVVAGTGPLLLVVATQLHKAGVEVLALLEAGRPRFQLGAAARALGQPGMLRDAAGYLWQLKRAGIPLRFNHTVFAAEGARGVERVTYGPVDEETWAPRREQARTVDADLLVVGFGFVPSSELAALAGCAMDYRHALGGWIPARDPLMRTRAPCVFAVGDGAGVAGVLVAKEEGRLAGITAAEDAGKLSAEEASRRRAGPLAKLRSLSRVREVLDALSAPRPGLLALAAEDTTVCRCEEVRRGEVDEALRAGAGDLQAVKLACRLGMGACQGRNCAPCMGMYIADRLNKPVEELGRINPRPPVKPVTLGALARLELPPEGGP